MGEGGSSHEVVVEKHEQRGGTPPDVRETRGTEQVGPGDNVTVKVRVASNVRTEGSSEATGIGGTPASTVDSVTDGTNSAVDSGDHNANAIDRVTGTGAHEVHATGGQEPDGSDTTNGTANVGHVSNARASDGPSGTGGQPSAGSSSSTGVGK